MRRPLLALAVALVAAAPAAAIPAVSGPPGVPLRAAPPLAPGPPNGAFTAGLDGWTVAGTSPPLPQPRGVRLAGDTSIVSSPFAVPGDAQLLTVTARSPALAATLDVLARPEDGGADVLLGSIEPAAAARAHGVGLAPVAGRTVRIVLDPVPALGGSLDVLGVGPVTAPLPLWTVERGSPATAGPARAPYLHVPVDDLAVTSPRFSPGPGARALIVAIRGEGVVRADAGGRTVTARAAAAWRDLRIPLPRGRRSVALRLEVRPGTGAVDVRDPGAVRRAVFAGGLRRATSSGRTRVTGRLVPAGGGLAVELRDAAGRRVARGRADSAGRLRLSARATGRLTLVVPGDRTRIGARFGL
ncbi:MAG: hypothetical protein AB7V42_02690 [Thermoleophilia bacterium]